MHKSDNAAVPLRGLLWVKNECQQIEVRPKQEAAQCGQNVGCCQEIGDRKGLSHWRKSDVFFHKLYMYVCMCICVGDWVLCVLCCGVGTAERNIGKE